MIDFEKSVVENDLQSQENVRYIGALITCWSNRHPSLMALPVSQFRDALNSKNPSTAKDARELLEAMESCSVHFTSSQFFLDRCRKLPPI